MLEDDDLACSFDDARDRLLREGARLTTRDKVAFFEEMIEFASRFAREPQRASRSLIASPRGPSR